MDPNVRFSLRELHAAMAASYPELKYKTLYSRFASLRKRGHLPANVNINALTLEQARIIARCKSKPTGRHEVRKATVTMLRQQLHTDGLL